MTQEHEQRLVRACLAALARRADVCLVVTFAEIEAEYDIGREVAIVIDGDAKCARITAPEVKA